MRTTAQRGDKVSWQHGAEKARRDGVLMRIDGSGGKRTARVDRLTGCVTVKYSRLKVEKKAPRTTLAQVLDVEAFGLKRGDLPGLEEAIRQWMWMQRRGETDQGDF